MLYLRQKIKQIVKNEDDLNNIMDFIYWEASKLLHSNPLVTQKRLKKYLKK